MNATVCAISMTVMKIAHTFMFMIPPRCFCDHARKTGGGREGGRERERKIEKNREK